MTMNCNICQKELIENAYFKGEISLKYEGEHLSLLGQSFTRPKFDISLNICEGCSVMLMNENMGILLNG